MADDTAPQIAFYVSSVEGRLVSRPGSPHSYIGAKIPTPDERKAGKSEPTWQPDVIVPVTAAEYTRFIREWDSLLNSKDLLKRSAEDFAAYSKALEDAEREHVAKLEAAAPKQPEAAPVAKKAEKSPGAKPAEGGNA